jgi:hypothetical protein
MTEIKRVEGLCEIFFEQGMEGVAWSVQEPHLPGYDGLHLLENGDNITIFNKTNDVFWTGIIDLRMASQSVLLPLKQRGVDPQFWQNMFENPRRTILVPRKAIRYHPFREPVEKVTDAILLMKLREENPKLLYQYYKTACSSWLGYGSQTMGFNKDEAMEIGSATPEMADKWTRWVGTEFNINIFVKLASLFNILGKLQLIFSDKDVVIQKWLGTPNYHNPFNGIKPKALVLSGFETIILLQRFLDQNYLNQEIFR